MVQTLQRMDLKMKMILQINLIIGKNYLFASNKEIEKAFFTWNRDYKLNPSKYSMEGSAEELAENKQISF